MLDNNKEARVKETLTDELINTLQKQLSEQYECILNIKSRIGRIHSFDEENEKEILTEKSREPFTHIEKLRDISKVLGENNSIIYQILGHLGQII